MFGKILKSSTKRKFELVVADLKLGSVILPRSESPQAISRLAEFEWFHKIETENDTVTPEIDDLLLRAQKTYQSIDDVVKGLQVPLQVGIMEILFKGTMIKKKQYELDEIETLDAVKKLNVNLGGFGFMKYFYTNLFVVSADKYAEITRSLEGVTIYKYDLENKEKIALIVIAPSSESEKVLKVFRAFDSNPFVIPQELPQIPSQAYSQIESKLSELTKKLSALEKDIAKTKQGLRRDILSLHEGAFLAKEVLEMLRKPGGTKLFAVIQGYIPKNMYAKFKDVTKQWMSVTEDISDPKLIQNRPTLFENKKFIRTFEVITQSQGIPRRGEADPTPMIALMWPIFYGLMFADLGHGLLLMGFGFLFKMKGQGTLSRWGMLIAISGASAAIAGVGSGEVFGFHLIHIGPIERLLEGPLHPVAWLVGVISVGELTFEQVITILKVSIFLGVIHLVWAFLLRIKRLRQEGHKQTMILEAIPNVTLYGGIVVVMMCAIGSGYDVMHIYSKVHTEAVPWVTVFLGDWAQVWIISRISIMIVLGSIAVMMVGGILHTKHHPEEGGSIANIVMEVLLGKTVECLSHTISYARIGIMLLVHAALLLTVNNSFTSLDR